MGIQDEIFDEFFSKLKKGKILSKSQLKEIKKLFESGKTEFQDDLIVIIERGSDNVSEIKNN